MNLSIIQKIAVWSLPVLFAVTVHEAAHAWVADKLGDRTAASLGRVTLNPIKHIDILGTIILPLLLVATAGFVFGWAKPVPVNVQNFHKPRRDFAIVAVAGPISNFIMAVIWSGISAIGRSLAGNNADDIFVLLILMGEAGVLINVMLMIFNMLPIPPLDGSRLVSAVVPKQVAYQMQLFENYGFIILLALMFMGLFSYLSPWVYGIGISILGWFN